jgi:hypothetical protein
MMEIYDSDQCIQCDHKNKLAKAAFSDDVYEKCASLSYKGCPDHFTPSASFYQDSSERDICIMALASGNQSTK